MYIQTRDDLLFSLLYEVMMPVCFFSDITNIFLCKLPLMEVDCSPFFSATEVESKIKH